MSDYYTVAELIEFLLAGNGDAILGYRNASGEFIAFTKMPFRWGRTDKDKEPEWRDGAEILIYTPLPHQKENKK